MRLVTLSFIVVVLSLILSYIMYLSMNKIIMRSIMQSFVKEPLNEVHNVLEEDSTDTKFVTVSIQFEAKPICIIM